MAEQNKSQVLIATMIVLMITLAIGAAVLMFSRSTREATHQQLYQQQACSLAKSGLEMATKCFKDDPKNCNIPTTPFTLGDGTFTITFNKTSSSSLGGELFLNVDITSTGESRETRCVLKNMIQKTISSSGLGWVYNNGIDASLHGVVAPLGVGYSGFAFFGVRGDPFSYDYQLIKTDDQGNILGGSCTSTTCWVKTYAGTYGEYIYYDNFRQSRASAGGYDGYVIGGFTDSFGLTSTDPFIVKVNPDGSLNYAMTYAMASTNNLHEEIMSISQDTDFDYILAGYSRKDLDTGADAFLFKVDSQTGNAVKFCKKYKDKANNNPGKDEYLYCVRESTDNNGFIAGGWANSYGVTNPKDILLIKTDANGTIGSAGTWVKTYDAGSSYDELGSLEVTRNAGGVADGYILAGESLFSNRSVDFILIRTDLSGNKIWAKTYGGTSQDYYYGVLKQLFDKSNQPIGYLVGGLTYSFGKGDGDFLLIKTDLNGNVGPSYSGTWAKTYGSPGNEQLYSLDNTTNGDGYVLGGITDVLGTPGVWDFFAMKIGLSGEFGCTGDDDFTDEASLMVDITSSVVATDRTAATTGSTTITTTVSNRTSSVVMDSPATNKTDFCN